MWPKGEGQFSLVENFQKFLGGWKIFPTLFLVNFDVFLVDFDAKTQMRGKNLPKIQNGGRTDHQMAREKFSEIFEGVGKLTFPTPS